MPVIFGRCSFCQARRGDSASCVTRNPVGASSRLRFAPGLEVTLETNPGTAEHGRFEHYRAAGVNRISFGIQSFDDGCLARLGRIHDSAEAERAVKLAQDAGLDNLNLDLMYALPGQTLAMAEHDLQRAFALQPAHVSHYQLTLEPNTVFFARPPQGIPDDDLAWDMQEHCQALLADAGYQHYEVSAYARAGRRCAHNLNYWRYGDYIGIGAGAHGKISSGASGEVRRRWKPKNPRDFLAHAGTPRGIGGDDPITPANLPFDYMLNALRLRDGFKLQDFTEKTGLPVSALQTGLDEAERKGLIERDLTSLRPTERGFDFLNDLQSLFLSD